MADLRRMLVERLNLLGVEDRPLPGRVDGFSGLWFGGKEFAHFHNDNELDIRLTRKIIEHQGLRRPANSITHPNRSETSHWIEVRLDTPADLERLVELIEAIVRN